MTPRAWALFAAMSAIWGIPYLFIKIAVDHGVPPLFVAWSRVALGAALLLPIAVRAGALEGIRAKLPWIVLFAATEICIPFPLIGYGEVHVSSSVTAILIATVPLLIALLTLFLVPEERVTRRRLAGLLIGLAGVVALVGIDIAGDRDEVIGALCIFGAACGYSIGPMVVQARLREVDPRGVSACALGLAALILAPLAAFRLPDGVPDAGAIASIVVLGVVCSALAFVVFFALIVEAGPTRGAVVTYINPAVAVLLGVTLLGESLGAASFAGLLLILAGSWVATGGRRRPEPAPQPARS
jgi:drug/metabolite transporter (DMT)-like permease